jgi:hypothetical protein
MTTLQTSDAPPASGDDNTLVLPHHIDFRATMHTVWKQLRDKASTEGEPYEHNGVNGFSWKGHFVAIVRAAYPEHDAMKIQIAIGAPIKKLGVVAKLRGGGAAGAVPAEWWVADKWPEGEPTTRWDDDESESEVEAETATTPVPAVAAPAAPGGTLDELTRMLAAHINNKAREKTEGARKGLVELRNSLEDTRDRINDTISEIDAMIEDLDAQDGDPR